MVFGWIRQTIKWQGTEDGTESFEQLIIHTLDLQGKVVSGLLKIMSCLH